MELLRDWAVAHVSHGSGSEGFVKVVVARLDSLAMVLDCVAVKEGQVEDLVVASAAEKAEAVASVVEVGSAVVEDSVDTYLVELGRGTVQVVEVEDDYVLA